MAKAKIRYPEKQARSNLRLPADVVAAIDAARARRPGQISRNTWITEAVEEKLAREGAANDTRKPPDG